MANLKKWPAILAGTVAGAINGLFGAGGGMILVPLLRRFFQISSTSLFPTSVSIILPLTLVSIGMTALQIPLPIRDALPYLLGSLAGGIIAGIWGKKIPTVWLHRLLGAMILWGGVRYLWI